MRWDIRIGKRVRRSFIFLLCSMGSFCLCQIASQALAKGPVKTSIQQCWLDANQTAVIEIISRFDIFQGPLSNDQMAAIRKKHPDIILLPFDSMMERGLLAKEAQSGEKPSALWLADPDDFGSSQRVFWDIGDDCTEVGGQRYRDWKVETTLRHVEGLDYDGVYLDLWHRPWEGLFPMPRMIESEYIDGMTDFADELRSALRQRYGREPVILSNPAKALNFSYSINGFMWEDFPTFSWPENAENILQAETNWMENTVGHREKRAGPSILIVNIRARNYGQDDPKFWQSMRYATGLTLLGDNLYVMFNSGWGGSPHWASPWWFDEWSIDLGEPLGKAGRLPNGVWYRNYERGLVLVNDTNALKTVTDQMLRDNLPSYDGPYYRFRGSQQPALNDGSRLGDDPSSRVDLAFFYRDESDGRLSNLIGDAIVLVKTPRTVVSPIFLDDTACRPPNNIQGRFETNGMNVYLQEGLESFCDNHYDPFPNAWRSFPRDSAHYAPPGDGRIFARWTPRIGVPGRYEVFAWFPDEVDARVSEQEGFGAEDLATRVDWKIRHADGEALVVADLKGRGGKWLSLGTHPFEAGTDGYVEITDAADGYVVADAVKFVYRGAADGCAGDLNRDGSTDVLDLQQLLNLILNELDPEPCSDLDEDGEVNVLDLQALVARILGA